MSGTQRKRTIVQTVLAGVVALAMVMVFSAVGSIGPTFAKGGNPGGNANHSGQTRPGCGFGDPNHTHTGAPGNPGACSRTTSATHTRHSETETESQSTSSTGSMTPSTSKHHHRACTAKTHKKTCKQRKHHRA